MLGTFNDRLIAGGGGKWCVVCGREEGGGRRVEGRMEEVGMAGLWRGARPEGRDGITAVPWRTVQRESMKSAGVEAVPRTRLTWVSRAHGETQQPRCVAAE